MRHGRVAVIVPMLGLFACTNATTPEDSADGGPYLADGSWGNVDGGISGDGDPCPNDGSCGTPEEKRALLLADINRLPAKEGSYVLVGDNVFFAAADQAVGLELWAVDKASGVVSLVKDIRPGASSSSPRMLTPLGDMLYFIADDGVHGVEIWRTDGTEAGTRLVIDLHSGPESSTPNNLTPWGTNLYFSGEDPTERGVWKLDTNSHDVTFLYPSDQVLANFTLVGQALYFTSERPSERLLFQTDGTSEGTRKIAGDVTGLAGVGDTLYFIRNGILYRRHTETNTRIYTPTFSSSWLSDVVSAGNRAYFSIVQTFPSWRAGSSLGATSDDGQSAQSLLWIGTVHSAAGTALGNTFFFPAANTNPDTPEAQRGLELWRSDGTTKGTYMVMDIYPGSGGSSPRGLLEFDGNVFFAADSPGEGGELWMTTGEQATTHSFDLFPGPASSSPTMLSNADGTLYFSARTTEDRAGPWKSDGTEEGTEPLMTEAAVPTDDCRCQVLGAADGLLFFSAYHPDSGQELWATDGTPAGTRMVLDIFPGPQGSVPHGFAHFPGGRVLFSASDGVHGRELWQTDGTPEGTTRLTDMVQGSEGFDPELDRAAFFDGALFFPCKPSGSICRTDGTPEGTRVMASGFSPVPWIAAAGDRLYIGTRYSGLWISDGTEPGTAVLAPIDTEKYIATLGDQVLFSGCTPEGCTLWRSDGTEEGTVLVKDIVEPSLGVERDGVVYFAATEGELGRELWRTDGTTEGTHLVHDIASGVKGSNPEQLTVGVDGNIFFSADDGDAGRELWRTDGTATGTVMVRDMRVGSSSSNPSQLLTVSGKIYFTAGDDRSGVELWVTDGTEANTSMLLDVNAGPGSSMPTGLTWIDSRLVFFASDAISGVEPRTYTP